MTTTVYLNTATAIEAASLHLIDRSALAGCVRLDLDPLRVTKLWPGLSTGEQLLWDALASLNGDGQVDLSACADRLDATSARALHIAVGLACGVLTEFANGEVPC